MLGRVEGGCAGVLCIPMLVLEDGGWRQRTPVRAVLVSSRIAKLEADPARAAALARARNRIAAKAQFEGKPTLTSLRLTAGMSQSTLANKVGTQQSNVSRWESDPSDLQVQTILRLADALGVDSGVVFGIVAEATKEHLVGR